MAEIADHSDEACRVQVIKVGGSWLTLPDAPERLRRWLDSPAATPHRPRLLLVGGGPVVDGLREIDRVHPFDRDAMHYAAIEAMDLNARLLREWLPAWRYTSLARRVIDGGAREDRLLAPGRWLRREEPAAAGRPLEVGWGVTSDAIAARLAEVLDGSLTLLKRRRPPSDPTDLKALVDSGYVDASFPRVAARVAKVRFAWPDELAGPRS